MFESRAPAPATDGGETAFDLHAQRTQPLDIGPESFLDTSPGLDADLCAAQGGGLSAPWQHLRVLVVSADAHERTYLRARLALAHLVWVDEACTTTQAQVAMDAHRYLMAVFNLDSPVVDGLGLSQRFGRMQPDAVCVITGHAAPGWLGRWRQWRHTQALQGSGVALLSKPLLPKRLAKLFSQVYCDGVERYGI